MPITLTTPFDPGDLDTVTYAQVEIVGLKENKPAKFFKMHCQYGNTVGGYWEPGKVHMDQFKIFGSYYATIIVTPSAPSEYGYVTLYKSLYQWLIDQGHYHGTY